MIYGPVKLSMMLRNFLGYTMHQMRDKVSRDVELKHAVELISSKSVEEINAGMALYDGHKPFDIKDLRQELASLVSEWKHDYSIELLWELNNTGLKTHMKASEIGINHGFEIEGPQGDGGSGVRKQWKRIENPLDERVLAIVTYAYNGTSGKTEVFDANTIVRPHYGGPRPDNHVGGSIPTPEEVVEGKQRWDDYRTGSDAIEKRVRDRIRKEDRKAKINLCYSCYKTDERGVPIDNLDEVAIEGKAIITQLCDYKDDDEGHDDYESPIVENPTWLDVCVLFNKAILRTGDYHHAFLEGVYKTKNEKDGVPIYRFSTGS